MFSQPNPEPRRNNPPSAASKAEQAARPAIEKIHDSLKAARGSMEAVVIVVVPGTPESAMAELTGFTPDTKSRRNGCRDNWQGHIELTRANLMNAAGKSFVILIRPKNMNFSDDS